MIDWFKSLDPAWQTGLKVLFILLSSWITAALLRRLLVSKVKPGPDKPHLDATTISFVKNAVNFVIFLLMIFGIVYTIPSLRTLALSLTAGAGVAAAILAFAAQSAMSNIISGIFLVIFRPFRVNDRIKVGQLYEGIVEDITIRHTVIRDFNFRRIIIPNQSLSQEVIINSDITDQKIARFLEIPVSYRSDWEAAQKIVDEQVRNHPDFVDIRDEAQKAANEPLVTIRAIQYDPYGILLRAYIWGDPGTTFKMCSDLRLSIKQAFKEQDIRFASPSFRIEDFHSDPNKQ
ncbi:mechanosensitive ion channel family protein [Pontibacter sp. G13]|uniref:mechanosensitive ion channel family protein n=1 Tax=Pontibacter sp. G13 TaxID=3074898 RepID=UPI00288BE904|nr:mechanosensitive ion channel family protein [Pontibacter sp. G13]WNJ17981.1 mechanosensitive ion channel family protein [Pontibacter sp. G13]